MITARKIFRFKIIFYGIFVGLQSKHKLILIIMHMNNALKFLKVLVRVRQHVHVTNLSGLHLVVSE